jgi:hypothetical protein
VGQSKAYWLLIVLPLLPLCIYAAMLVRVRQQGDLLSQLKREKAEEGEAMELPPVSLSARSASLADGAAATPAELSGIGADDEQGGRAARTDTYNVLLV